MAPSGFCIQVRARFDATSASVALKRSPRSSMLHHETGLRRGVHIVPSHDARMIHALVAKGVSAHGFH